MWKWRRRYGERWLSATLGKAKGPHSPSSSLSLPLPLPLSLSHSLPSSWLLLTFTTKRFQTSRNSHRALFALLPAPRLPARTQKPPSLTPPQTQKLPPPYSPRSKERRGKCPRLTNPLRPAGIPPSHIPNYTSRIHNCVCFVALIAGVGGGVVRRQEKVSCGEMNGPGWRLCYGGR